MRVKFRFKNDFIVSCIQTVYFDSICHELRFFEYGLDYYSYCINMKPDKAEEIITVLLERGFIDLSEYYVVCNIDE